MLTVPRTVRRWKAMELRAFLGRAAGPLAAAVAPERATQTSPIYLFHALPALFYSYIHT